MIEAIEYKDPAVVAKYEVYMSFTGHFHYRARLEVNGEDVDSTSGCSVAPHWFGWNRASCEREARRACAKMFKLHARRVAAGEPVEQTVLPEEFV